MDLFPVEGLNDLLRLRHQFADLFSRDTGKFGFARPLDELRLIAVKLDVFDIQFIGDELLLLFERMRDSSPFEVMRCALQRLPHFQLIFFRKRMPKAHRRFAPRLISFSRPSSRKAWICTYREIAQMDRFGHRLRVQFLIDRIAKKGINGAAIFDKCEQNPIES